MPLDQVEEKMRYKDQCSYKFAVGKVSKAVPSVMLTSNTLWIEGLKMFHGLLLSDGEGSIGSL